METPTAKERPLGCRDSADGVLSLEVLSGTAEAHQVLGRRAGPRVHVPDQRHWPFGLANRGAL